MSVFCLFWLPLFFLFWSDLVPYEINVSSILAVSLGSITAIARFFFGDFVDAGAFGPERWIGIFVDRVALPALLPLFIYAFFLLFRIAKDPAGFGSFALLWLVPAGILRTVQWSVENDPAKLVLIPVLWTSITVCVSFFINLCIRKKIWVIIPSVLGMIAISPLAATVYWAFFSQKAAMIRYGSLAGTLILLVAAVVCSWRFRQSAARDVVHKDAVCNT
ncbi:MAG: hypothetical protein LBB61_08305 [Treponema sp.]|jgi:hypothetical protein|nr:hypothetical protein [Treponema sp.]